MNVFTTLAVRWAMPLTLCAALLSCAAWLWLGEPSTPCTPAACLRTAN